VLDAQLAQGFIRRDVDAPVAPKRAARTAKHVGMELIHEVDAVPTFAATRFAEQETTDRFYSDLVRVTRLSWPRRRNLPTECRHRLAALDRQPP